MTLAVLSDATSGSALAAIVVALGLIALIVARLVPEARATNSTRRKMPFHILLVGSGSAVVLVLAADTMLEHVGVRFLGEWAESVFALMGGLLLVAGLWKMVEVQRRTYTTLGNTRPEGERRAPHPLGPDEEADSLVVRTSEALARQRIEQRVLHAILFAGLIFGLAQLEGQTDDVSNLTDQVVQANREGCERTNVLRNNQAALIQEEFDRNEAALAKPLGPALEPFRRSIEEAQAKRLARIQRLKDSVNHGAGVRGKPFDVDCVKAYP